MASTARFQAEQTRSYLLRRGFKPEYIVPFCYRPFDVRRLYWEPETRLLDEKHSDYFPSRDRLAPRSSFWRRKLRGAEHRLAAHSAAVNLEIAAGRGHPGKAVWECTLGGYQVLKKWLSYREKVLLGRSIAAKEARCVTEMARRIAALILLGPALDANYESVKKHTFHWKPRA